MHVLDTAFTIAAAAAGAVAAAADDAGLLHPSAAAGLLVSVILGFAAIMAYDLIKTVKRTDRTSTELLTLVNGEGGVIFRLNRLEEHQLNRED